MFQMLACNVAALVIAAVYYVWRDGYHTHRVCRSEKVRRERVAYMLWIASQR